MVSDFPWLEKSPPLARQVRLAVLRKLIPTGRRMTSPVKRCSRRLLRLGTEYGGWLIGKPTKANRDRYAIPCGAGAAANASFIRTGEASPADV